MRFCQNCGTPLKEGSRFCSVCGTWIQPPSVQQAPQQPAPRPAPQPPVQAAPQPPVQAAPQLPVRSEPPTPVQAAPQPVFQTPPQAAPQRSPKKKKELKLPLWLVLCAGVLLLAAVVLGVLGLTSGKSSDRFEGSGYSSPEAAMEAYAAAFAQKDVDGMVSTFAVETLAERADFGAYLARMRAYQYTMDVYIQDNDYGQELTVQTIRSKITSELMSQYRLAVAAKQDLDTESFLFRPTTFSDEEEARQFASYFNDGTLFSSVEFVRVVDADEVFRALDDGENKLKNDRIQKILGEYTDIYGAQELNEGCVEVKVDGKAYWLFLQQAKYGGKWYNVSFRGLLPAILGLSSNASVIPKP